MTDPSERLGGVENGRLPERPLDAVHDDKNAVTVSIGFLGLKHEMPMPDLVSDGNGRVGVELEAIREILSATKNTDGAILWIATDHKPQENITIEKGRITIDLTNFEVRADGVPIGLTYIEFEILSYLAKNQGRLVSREELLENIWKTTYFGNKTVVDVHMSHIRKALGDELSKTILSIRNRGYTIRSDPQNTRAK